MASTSSSVRYPVVLEEKHDAFDADFVQCPLEYEDEAYEYIYLKYPLKDVFNNATKTDRSKMFAVFRKYGIEPNDSFLPRLRELVAFALGKKTDTHPIKIETDMSWIERIKDDEGNWAIVFNFDSKVNGPAFKKLRDTYTKRLLQDIETEERIGKKIRPGSCIVRE